MSLKNTFHKAVVAALSLLLPAGLAAQTSSINAFSPYTMYGIGAPSKIASRMALRISSRKTLRCGGEAFTLSISNHLIDN